LVERGTFRPDLYERLAGFRVDIPPLRCRRDEIPGLFFHWLRSHSSGKPPRVEAKLVETLSNHAWPGNARQLELFTRKLLALHWDDEVLRQSFALELLDRPTGEPTTLRPSASYLDRREHDRHLLNAALEENRGNMTAAARRVGISRRRAYRLLAEARGNGRDAVAEDDA
jgi:DNA-binding NtrC family response regulator